MNRLKLIPWDAHERELQFVGWLDDSRWTALVQDEQATRRALDLQLPSRFGLRFLRPPIPTSPPVEIRGTALHLPACLASLAEADPLFQLRSDACFAAQAMSPWQLAAREVLSLDPRHDPMLKQALTRHQRQRQQEREQRLVRLGAWIERHHPSPEEEAAARRRVEDLFTAVVSDPATGEPREVPEAKVTLDMVRQGWGGIHKQVLHAEWLKQHGTTAESLEEERQAFRLWLSQHAVNMFPTRPNSPATAREAAAILHLLEVQWRVLESAVRWRVRCADGSIGWLDGVGERDLQTAGESATFDTLESAAALGGAAPVTRAQALAELGDITPDWLRRLCRLTGVPFPPRNRADVDRLKRHQSLGKRRRMTKLISRNKESKGARH